MLDKKDAQWWVLEAQQHPTSAPQLIRLLAEQLALLDRENEQLRGELIALRRNQRAEGTNNADATALQQRIRELEGALRRGGAERHMLIYRLGQIDIDVPYEGIRSAAIGRAIEPGASLLIADATANLLAVTAESRAFNVSLRDLPMPESGTPARIESPKHVIALLDQTVFERCRYLTLVSQRGYLYSLLVGTVNRIAARQEPLIRNLVPGDPIVAAVPSNNTELIAVSRQGRWVRFPERAISGSGSLALDLPKGDALAGVAWSDADALAIFPTADGSLFVRRAADLPSRAAPGKSAGMLCRGRTLLGVAVGTPSQALIALTRCGTVLTSAISNLPYRAESDEGAPLPGLANDDSVIAFTVR